jgi:hypothetical protein
MVTKHMQNITHARHRSQTCSLLGESDFMNKTLETTIPKNDSLQPSRSLLSAKMCTFIVLIILFVYCFLRVLQALLFSVRIYRHRHKDIIKVNLREIRCEHLRLGLTGSGQDEITDIWKHGDEILS